MIRAPSVMTVRMTNASKIFLENLNMTFFLDVSVSDMNDEDGAGGSSKSNSITSEHSLQSTGISASSQGSSTNSLPKGVPNPPSGGPPGGMGLMGLGISPGSGLTSGLIGAGPGGAAHASALGLGGNDTLLAQSHDSHGHHHHHPPTGFHRSTLSQPQGGPSPSLSAKSKLSQVSIIESF